MNLRPIRLAVLALAAHPALALLILAVPALAQQAGWEVHDNLTFTTGDRIRFFGMPGGTAAECQAICEHEAGCAGYNYVRPGAYAAGDPAVCYLFSGLGELSAHPCCVAGFRVQGGVPRPPAAAR